MKLGNFVLRCAFLQIFIVFVFFSCRQTKKENVDKYEVIEAINCGNFKRASKEIKLASRKRI